MQGRCTCMHEGAAHQSCCDAHAETMHARVLHTNAAVLGCQVMVQGERKRRLQGISRTLYAVSTWPQLYIYSSSDCIIPHDVVTLWVEARADLNLPHTAWIRQASSATIALACLQHAACACTHTHCWVLR